MIDIGIVEVFFFSNRQHLITVVFRQEFALLIQQFQRIPVAWIVARRDDNATGCLRHAHSQLGCRRGSQADVDYIIAHSHQCTTYNILYHFARNAGIATYNNRIAR